MTKPVLIIGKLYRINGTIMRYQGVSWEWCTDEFLVCDTLKHISFYLDDDTDESFPSIEALPEGFTYTSVVTTVFIQP